MLVSGGSKRTCSLDLCLSPRVPQRQSIFGAQRKRSDLQHCAPGTSHQVPSLPLLVAQQEAAASAWHRARRETPSGAMSDTLRLQPLRAGPGLAQGWPTEFSCKACAPQR